MKHQLSKSAEPPRRGEAQKALLFEGRRRVPPASGQETRAFSRAVLGAKASFGRVGDTSSRQIKSRGFRSSKRSARRPRRFFSWLVASLTIVIFSSKTAQVETSRPGASSTTWPPSTRSIAS